MRRGGKIGASLGVPRTRAAVRDIHRWYCRAAYRSRDASPHRILPADVATAIDGNLTSPAISAGNNAMRRCAVSYGGERSSCN
jgi:hypothetical protein